MQVQKKDVLTFHFPVQVALEEKKKKKKGDPEEGGLRGWLREQVA